MKTFMLCLLLVFATLVPVNTSAAQGLEPGPRPIVEIFACNFVGSNDLGDLLSVAERWNDWADDNDVTDYTAIILTPYLFSDQLAADVLWLGAYPSGEAMGAGEANWLTEGQEMAAEFGEVADCTSHSQFVALNVRVPEGPPPAVNGMLRFTDCTLREGRLPQQAFGAATQWTNYLADNGHEGFDSMLFPVAGESPDASYSFKAVHGFPSPEAYGQVLDIVSSGGLQVATQLFGPIVECNSPRVYVTTRIRAAAEQQ